MPAPVYFRGPILFRVTPEKATEALVPDAERTLTTANGTPGYHPDGTPTTMHYPGLVVAKDDTILVQLSLRKKLVTISDGTSTVCTYPTAGLIPVDDTANKVMPNKVSLINPGDASYWARVAARITFVGGTLSDWLTTTIPFRVPPAPGAAPICMAPMWKSSGAMTSIEITEIDGTGKIEIHPSDDQQVYLYNWDLVEPPVKSITNTPAAQPSAAESEDTDFKWLYQLYDIPEQFATKKVTATLPAPMAMFTLEKEGESGTTSVGSASCVAGKTSA